MYRRCQLLLTALVVCVACCPAQSHFDEWTILHFQQAREAEQAGRLDIAAAEYEAVLSRNPMVGEIWVNLGLVYYRQRRYDASIKTLRRAVSINPNMVGAQLFLGISLYMTQDFVGAVRPLQRALALNPGDRQAQLYLSLVFLALDQPEKAANQLRQTLAAFPDDIEILYRLGEACIEGASQGSRVLFERYRDSSSYHWARGIAAEQENDMAQAIASYLRAVEQDPTIPQIYWRLIVLFDRAGMPGLAAAARHRTRLLAPGLSVPIAGQNSRSTPLSEREQTAIQQTWVKLPPLPSERAVEAVADADTNWSLYMLLKQPGTSAVQTALRLYNEGRFPLAAERLRAMLNDGGSRNWVVPYLLARSYVWIGDYETAQDILETHLKTFFDLQSVALLRMEIQTPLASLFLDRVVAKAPESWQAKILEAKSAASRHQITEAIATYREVLSLRPTLPGIHLAIGNLYTNRQEWHLAIQEYLAELELAPDNGLALAMLGRAYLEIRDADKAITTLRESLERYPDSSKALADLGKALAMKDRTEDAIGVFNRALNADPGDYSIHYRLFQLYQKAGQSELARHHLAVFRDMKKKNDVPK